MLWLKCTSIMNLIKFILKLKIDLNVNYLLLTAKYNDLIDIILNKFFEDKHYITFHWST